MNIARRRPSTDKLRDCRAQQARRPSRPHLLDSRSQGAWLQAPLGSGGWCGFSMRDISPRFAFPWASRAGPPTMDPNRRRRQSRSRQSPFRSNGPGSGIPSRFRAPRDSSPLLGPVRMTTSISWSGRMPPWRRFSAGMITDRLLPTGRARARNLISDTCNYMCVMHTYWLRPSPRKSPPVGHPDDQGRWKPKLRPWSGIPNSFAGKLMLPSRREHFRFLEGRAVGRSGVGASRKIGRRPASRLYVQVLVGAGKRAFAAQKASCGPAVLSIIHI